jgi:hypothetical protein
MNVSSHRIKVAVDLQRVFITSSVELLGLVVHFYSSLSLPQPFGEENSCSLVANTQRLVCGYGFCEFRSEGKLSFFGWVEIPFLSFSPLLHSFIGFLHQQCNCTIMYGP